MKRTTILILLAILVGIGMNPRVSFAQEDELFIAINQDESLTETERFEMAKDGLGKALVLALEKVAQLTSDLDNRQFDEGTRGAEVKALYLLDLVGYNTFYSEALATTPTLENLEAVQALAQKVKDYRDTTYTPGVENIVEFVLVFYSEDILKTATERFEKISADIEKLETLGLIDAGVFTEQINSINTLLTDAGDLRLQASEIILAVQPQEATTTVEAIASSTEAEIDTLPLTAETAEVVEEVAPRMLLQTSLGNVKSAYELFLEISNSVKITLGLE